MSLFAAKLRRHVKSNDLEHDGVHGNCGQLILNVVLVLVGPAVHIVRLHIDLVGPVRVLLFVAVLVEQSQLHHRGASDVVSHGRQVLAHGLASALVVEFSQNGGPTVFEKVERLLSIEREHGEPVG